MNKKLFSVGIICMAALSAMGKTVNVKTPGTLASYIDDSEKYTTKSLIVTGSINELDLAFIRDMAGEQTDSTSSDGKLSTLDLSGAKLLFHDEYGDIEDCLPENALARCQSLTHVVLPDGVTFIDESALAYNPNLLSIEVSADNQDYTSINGALYNKSATELIQVPGGLEVFTLAKTAECSSADPFRGCYVLDSIYVEKGSETNVSVDGLLYTGNGMNLVECPPGRRGNLVLPAGTYSVLNAFNDSKITSLTLGENTGYVMPSAFKGAKYFKEYKVPQGNASYCAINGVLYSKDTIDLVSVPVRMAEIEFASHVKGIGNYAMAYNQTLRDVELPEGVAYVGEDVLYGDDNVRKLVLPSTLRNVTYGSFSHTPALRSVYSYATTPAKGYFAFSDVSDECVLYVPYGCSDAYYESNSFNAFATIKEMAPAYKQAMVCEELTGTWCGWCIRGIVGMEEAKAKYGDRFIGLAVHQSDPMMDRDYDNSVYNLISKVTQGVGLPHIIMNRDANYCDDPLNMATMCENLAKKKFADASVETSATLDPSTRKVTTSTTVNFIEAHSNANYRLAYVVLEDMVHKAGDSKYDQENYYSGGSTPMGGYENKPKVIPADQMYYRDVVRGAVSDFNGIEGSIPSEINAVENITYDYDFSLPESVLNDNYTKLVVMLLDGDGKIVNATEVPIGSQATGISDINAGTGNAAENARFNASGMRISTPQRGLNVIRYSNGTTKKVIVR